MNKNFALGVLGIIFFTSCITLLQKPKLTELASPGSTSLDKSVLELRDEQQRMQFSILESTPDFGFSNLVADWTFLNFLQYFGDTSARAIAGYQLSPNFFNTIVKKDPLFIESYLYLTTSVSIHAGRPEEAIQQMSTGLEAMSPTLPATSYLVWRYKGIDELLFLGDGEAAQQSFLNAALWAEKSPDPNAGSVAEVSRRTADFLEDNSASTSAQISSWAQVLVRAVDEYTIRLATERIEALGGEIVVSSSGRVSIRHKAD